MLDIIFFVAITAEAMTAALAAGRRNMDWFGVCLLASVAALGGAPRVMSSSGTTRSTGLEILTFWC